MNWREAAVGRTDVCLAVNPFQKLRWPGDSALAGTSTTVNKKLKNPWGIIAMRLEMEMRDGSQVSFHLMYASRLPPLLEPDPQPASAQAFDCICFFVTNFSIADLLYPSTAAVCWNKSCWRASLTTQACTVAFSWLCIAMGHVANAMHSHIHAPLQPDAPCPLPRAIPVACAANIQLLFCEG